MSNREPCLGHSTVQAPVSNSPSASGPLSCEQRSSIAYSVPSQLNTPISRSSHSTSFRAPGGSSLKGQTSIFCVGIGWCLAVVRNGPHDNPISEIGIHGHCSEG